MSKIVRIPALLLALLAAPLAVGCDPDDDDDEKTNPDDKPGPSDIADPDDDDDETGGDDKKGNCKVPGNLPPNQPDPDGAIKACPD